MDWVRGHKLGQGSFATVSLAVSSGGNPSQPPLMAVKSCGASFCSSLSNEKSVLQEIGGCPEIIRCFGDSFSLEKGERLYNVLLEYASGGSLADRVKKSGGQGLPEFEIRRYTRALLRGLKHIHGSGYVHCDVKLQNVLLGADGGVRIADFGLARRGGGAATPGGCELRGTPMYMSPEMVAGGEQGPAADVWALGCAVAEMATGRPAWGGFSDAAALMMRIGVGDRVPEAPGNLSGEGRDFLEKCFVKDPSRRWTAEMLLGHPFVGGDEGGASASISPRCIFDYPEEWVSDCSPITCTPQQGYFGEVDLWSPNEPSSKTEAAARLAKLVSERGPDWSVSDGWITVR
ncbi:mitogen-activated protein kinase kinase kinase 21 [Striga hermonthica]|uniref:Mitogen-activated protein kinase kinase kinase 21 n=1 Tax=Striga hermonthica TaxID=68872 RepID=A0A9N7NYJ2_STRHE|nr:mitogen-activated protein kinase kinase kinase 21 [Striga hermonthica]